MQNKSIHRNVMAATALLAGSTTFSKIEQATWGSGIRLYITVTGASTTAGTDGVFLCGVPPAGGNPVPIVGFAGASMLSVNGVYIADWYPGAWLPTPAVVGGKLLGAAGIYIPITWAIQVVMGAGSAATITIDAELLP